MTEKSEVRIRQRFYWLSNTIFHQVLAVTCGFIFYIFFKSHDLTSARFLHNFLASGAYIPLMAEGFILFTESNVWSLEANRSIKGWVHGALLSVSVICASVGIIVEIIGKNKTSSPHFHTLHAKLGLASWIMCFTLVLSGLLTVYAAKLRNYVKPLYIKLFHEIVGLACFVTGVYSLYLGLPKWGFAMYVTASELTATKTLVIIVAVWSILGTCVSIFNNIKNVFT
ncbi:probable transmembrane reductase CYB561D1 isoform X1 [Diabrotica virgifera virgifera]|uniref:ascorbate ferrireductase (transmembrane) n=1 Tax=Diabrotica virgifera virgifera TaxID=50390 RepID=A0ABM5IN65_DIAVI|nr:probable transmembrane reductase CYB561D1 isoform X1 [Diabrotica virgifera virgifera]